MHASQRFLVVTADDFGIGPATTHGILELALQGRVTATVLLVNSPHAEAAVRAWRQAGCVPELGWHPCLTLDRPVRPPEVQTEHGSAESSDRRARSKRKTPPLPLAISTERLTDAGPTVIGRVVPAV